MFHSLCVIGLGYIGLPTAAMFATHGMKVHGVDINKNIIEILNNHDIHIEECGLKEVVKKAFDSGNLTVSSSVEVSDAYIIAVPTPFKHGEYGEYQGEKYKLSDMSAVVSAAESIVPFLKKDDLVILESTSPVRTTIDIIRPILEKTGITAGQDFSLAYSPERVLPGQIIREMQENARVIGGIDARSAEMGKDLYSAFVKGEIFLTDATTAEMVKLMENTYRDVNIAIANEYSRLADRFGVDVYEAIAIANKHPRVKILNPGPGVGGHCISVDPWFFVESAPDLAKLILESRKANDSQPAFIVDVVKRKLGTLVCKRIAALGLSYKADVDDLRESPSIEVIHLLQKEGAIVIAYEPNKLFPNLDGITTCRTLKETLVDADAAIFLVAHHEFIDLELNNYYDLLRNVVVFSAIPEIRKERWNCLQEQFVQIGNGKIQQQFLDKGKN